jgi:hypothetical protein
MSAGFFESMCPSKMRRWDNAVRTNGKLATSVGHVAVRAADQHDKKSRRECPTIYAIEADPRIATSLLPHVPEVHGSSRQHFTTFTTSPCTARMARWTLVLTAMWAASLGA